jgi:hypothetical protein
MELMQRHDGELTAPEPADDAGLDADAAAKLRALAEISAAVRTHLELAADDADARLEALWGTIERRIAGEAQAAAPTRAPVPEPARTDRGLIGALADWLERYRGHIMTGAVAAAAAGVLIVALRPPQTVIRERLVTAPGAPERAAATTLVSSPPVVESLDVSEGSGTILTVPGDEGENPTTVIWVTRDDMEGPI